MTSYTHLIELDALEFAEMLSFAAKHISEQPHSSVGWNDIIGHAISGYVRDAQRYSFHLQDYQTDYLPREYRQRVIDIGKSQMSSTSSFCYPDGQIPADVFTPNKKPT